MYRISPVSAYIMLVLLILLLYHFFLVIYYLLQCHGMESDARRSSSTCHCLVMQITINLYFYSIFRNIITSEYNSVLRIHNGHSRSTMQRHSIVWHVRTVVVFGSTNLLRRGELLDLANYW